MTSVEDYSNDTFLLRLENPQWNLSHFKSLLSRLSKLERPKAMTTNGLWELPLTGPYASTWRQAELMSTETLKEIGGKKMMMLPHEEWKQVLYPMIFDMKLLGSPIYRMRVLALAPNTEQILHVDVPSDKPVWRFHFPLLTHGLTYMEFQPELGTPHQVHMPADGKAFLVNIALPHRVVNHDSKKWRLHFVADLIHWNKDLKTDQVLSWR